MSKKWAAGLAAISLGGCAWIFQEHLPSDYDHKSAPHCDTVGAPVVVDVISAVLDVIIVGAIANDTSNSSRGPNMAINAADGIVSVLSAGTGLKWSDDCKAARRKYDQRIARLERENPVPAPAPIVQPPGPPMPVAAFRCFASATDGNLGLCTRNAAECDEARAREVAPVGECVDSTIASCFRYVTVVDGVSHEVCGSTFAICNHRRDAAMAIGPSVGDVGECQEAK